MDHSQDDDKIDYAGSRTRSEHRYAPHRHPYWQSADVEDVPRPVIPRRGVSLRNFTASTGSYRWPRIEHTTSIDERPSLGLRHLTDDDGSSTSSHTSSHRSGGTSRPTNSPPSLSFPLPPLTANRRNSPSATLLEPMRRASLTEMEDDPSSSSSSSDDEMAPVASTTPAPASSFTLHRISSQTPGPSSPAAAHPAPPPSATSSTASGTTPSSSPTASTSAFTVDSINPVNRNAWEQYVERYPDKIYKCLWQSEKTGNACQYIGNRQLVKRHVETVHMKILRYACDFCGLRFPQKTNVHVHISSQHTRVKPNLCPYEGCDRTYNDPAALHRHKVSAHGYVPKPTKRQPKPGDPRSQHESLAPWSAQKEPEEGTKNPKSR